MEPKRHLGIDDHRLVRLVQETGDPTIAARLGVPRSTAAGWICRAPRLIIAVAGDDASLAHETPTRASWVALARYAPPPHASDPPCPRRDRRRLNRHQQRVLEYLREENRVLKAQLGRRKLRLTDNDRVRLAVRGIALGRMVLDEFASIVTPETILRWHRKLVAQKSICPMIRHSSAYS